MKNEKTSKRVASKAARVSDRLRKIIAELEALADDIESVSMSALTQAPDKRKK